MNKLPQQRIDSTRFVKRPGYYLGTFAAYWVVVIVIGTLTGIWIKVFWIGWVFAK